MKKLLSLLSFLIIATMVVTACGAPAPTQPAATEPAATEPAATEPAATEPAATEPATTGDRVQIRWFVGLGTGTQAEQIPAQEKVVEDFNASQDRIELVLEVVPNESARQTLATQIAAGAGPDIVGPVGWGGSNAFFGQWLDLAPYIESSGFDSSIFDQDLVNLYQTEEGTVGIPFLVFPAATYYIPSMFDEAGLEYPPAAYGDPYVLDGAEVEWNRETLAEVAKRLTVDVNGANATEAGFDPTQVAQFGFVPNFQTHVAYQATYIAGPADIVEGDSPGSYASAMPDSWKEANRWIYDGMWGEQPFIPNGPIAGSPEYGNGNPFNSGKVAMTVSPLWYTCCLDALRDAGFEFTAGALPAGLDGEPHGRVDADTFRIWKGTQHPEEAFEVLSYLIGPEGIQTLVVGSADVPAAYSGLPANPEFQQPYIDGLLERYPFSTPETWDMFIAGFAYGDNPSAEQWQPNWNEAWDRMQVFYDLMLNTPADQLDFDAEWDTLVEDLNNIYNQ
jgi:multiple sugar transport system substrate-binding protein